MGSELKPFHYSGREVRTIVLNGDPWFIAADVCAVLGVDDVRRAVERLDPDDRSQTPVVDAAGRRNPNTWVVNESGLYDLIIRSDKPEARMFRRWITAEVLPAIRATGTYSVARSQFDVLRDAINQIEAAQQTAERAETAATETSARLDAIEGRHDWFAALGYAKLTGLPTDTAALARLGRMASATGRATRVEPNKVQHALYGEVNQWPRWIWDAAADELGWDGGTRG